MYVPLEDKDMN